jgi:hypothetical protein
VARLTKRLADQKRLWTVAPAVRPWMKVGRKIPPPLSTLAWLGSPSDWMNQSIDVPFEAAGAATAACADAVKADTTAMAATTFCSLPDTNPA